MSHPDDCTIPHAALPCPYCGRPNDHHQRRPGEHPTDGAVGVCWGCHQPAMFTVVLGRLGLRLPTAAERAELDADPEYQQVLAAMRESYRPTEAAELLWGKR